jgi:hypothetical protein
VLAEILEIERLTSGISLTVAEIRKFQAWREVAIGVLSDGKNAARHNHSLTAYTPPRFSTACPSILSSDQLVRASWQTKLLNATKAACSLSS